LDRPADPALRRKLADITRQLDEVNAKYRDLRDLSVRDAETNFDRLKQSADARTKAQDELVESLRKEIALSRAQATDTTTLQTQIAALTAETKRLAADNKALTAETKRLEAEAKVASSEIQQLTSGHQALALSLQKAQADNQSLAAKLAAARAPPIPEPTASSGRGGGGPLSSATSAASSSSSSLSSSGSSAATLGDAANSWKLKEQIYGDLTGLIIRNVKRIDGEDVFDCFQTGRNGTLRFNLSVPVQPEPGQSYGEVEIAYTPVLHEKNDRTLLEILPDYLTEEICFPRSSAPKFYERVVSSMTKKIEA